MDGKKNRRGFLSLAASALAGVIGIVVTVTALPYILAPLSMRRPGRGPGAGFQDLGPVAGLPMGAWRLVPLELVGDDGWQQRRVRHAVWVRRDGVGETQIEVFSSICPHLGCLINWQSERSQFVCPCHGGTFHSSGQCVAGPPPRSMDRLEHRVFNGRLLVRWVDFKTGLARAMPLGA